MASTRFIGNPVYVVTRKADNATFRVRATSENKAIAKIAFKQGGERADFRAYQF